MSNETQVQAHMQLVHEFAGNKAKAHCERLYGTSESYTKWCLEETDKSLAAVEASARRLAEQGAPRKADDVDLLLRVVFELCEATVEAPEITPKNEHERGFDRGRRFEAKSIQKTMGQWFQLVFSRSGNV